MIVLESGCAVAAVPTDMVSVAWPSVAPLLSEALSYNHGVSTIDDVYDALEKGTASLWVAAKKDVLLAAAVAEVVRYPRGASLRIWLLAGRDMQHWKKGIALIERFGMTHECRFIEVIARRGMEKLIRDLGFETKFIWSIKSLDMRIN